MVDYKLIGSRIKEYREQASLTQEQVSEICDITSVYLSKIENGKVHPTLEILAKICSCLNCDLGEILLHSVSDSSQYQNERIVKIFNSCSPDVKPIALSLLEQLSKL